MDSRNLDLAAKFCELVGKPNLLEYLGLPETASPEALQKKLKARRKYMQGMQSNPKYRAEAIFLIKNFSALNGVLATPIPYVEDARRRAESQHLPVLEMTIKGVLAGGSLNYDQEDYLRRNAAELGVSDATFESVLERLATTANVKRATEDLTITPEELKTVDFYRMLGVPRHASRDEIYGKYRAKKEEAKALGDATQRDQARTRVEKAWKVLSDEVARQQYDLSWTRTGPPARSRDAGRPIQSSTAPPVQPRNSAPKPPPSAPFAGVNGSSTGPELAPPRLELLSRSRQKVAVGDTPVTVSIEVRNAGERPMRGTVTSSAPWLQLQTDTLQPGLKQQALRVRVDPAALTTRSAEGTVEIVTEEGDRTQVVFAVSKAGPSYVLPAVGAGLALLVLAGLGAVMMSTSRDVSYTIKVDPWAEQVLIDGNAVGNGNLVVIDAADGQEATVTVRHPNFRPWVRDVVVTPGETLSVQLVLDTPMAFKPAAGMKIAKLDPKTAVEVMEHFQPGLDRCLRNSAMGQKETNGVVRIHVGQQGRPIGFDVESDGGPLSPAIRDCLRRQVAGPLFPALADGEYATVRYDYVLPGR